jgi:uncharacterized RDD family membrane protein YckC
VGLRLPPSGFTDRTAALAGVRYASWLRRFAGLVIDILIILMIEYLILGVLSFTGVHIAAGFYTVLYYLSIVSPIFLAYATLCLAKLEGQTPGMRVMQIRCVPVSGRGSITIPQAFTRSIVVALFFTVTSLFYGRGGALVSLAVVVIPLVAYFWPLVDSRRQTWWDHVAATKVLDDRGW